MSDCGTNLPSEEQIRRLLDDNNNWSRWGPDDQMGTLNLITAEKRASAARLVRDGRAVSLGREIVPYQVSESGAVQCEVATHELAPGSVAATDYFGLSYHGFTTTHVDALCHIWKDGKLWNGRIASEQVDASGARWADISQWSGGIFTRGVLVDVPWHRGTPYVTVDRPVHGDEIAAILDTNELEIQPGDALLVHSGRAEWDRSNARWETLGPRWKQPRAAGVRPGLHASCLKFLRDADVAVLLWDMMDLSPSGYSFPWSVHEAIASFGLALVDNTSFDEVLPICRRLGRWEFLVVIAPLRVRGGTGCPVNPLAIF
ncbi:MAG: cyclase family protein [Haloechinothrix sp.]